MQCYLEGFDKDIVLDYNEQYGLENFINPPKLRHYIKCRFMFSEYDSAHKALMTIFRNF